MLLMDVTCKKAWLAVLGLQQHVEPCEPPLGTPFDKCHTDAITSSPADFDEIEDLKIARLT
jgi:hypothetical protein